jgi:NAD(P)-dependent dehydrogenase (short-subunit alcohol dehydrogenase family)
MDYYSNYVYQNSKGVFSLFGGYNNPRSETEGSESQGYFLDWKTKAWQKLEVSIDGIDMADYVDQAGAYVYETQDYVVLATTLGKPNLGWNIVEKETGLIFSFSSRNVDIGLSPFVEIMGNRLIYQSPSGDPKTLDLDDINFEKKKYDGWQSYSRSKFCNILFTRELARRLEGTGISVNEVHPVGVRNEIEEKNANWFTNLGRVLGVFWRGWVGLIRCFSVVKMQKPLGSATSKQSQK